MKQALKLLAFFLSLFLAASVFAQSVSTADMHVSVRDPKGAADRVGAGATPEAAAWASMDQLRDRLNGHGGIIVLDALGRWGMAHNTPRMAWARRDRREGTAVGIGCSRT